MSVLVYKRRKAKTVPNPVRNDPTHTATLRRSFITQMNLRMNRIKAAITRYIVTYDALRLTTNTITCPHCGSPKVQSARTVDKTKTYGEVGYFANTHCYGCNNGFNTILLNATQDQADAFQNWLKRTMMEGFDENDPANAFWREYIAKGWKQGQAKMFDAAGNRRMRTQDGIPSGFFQGKRSQILNDAFNNARSIEKLELLAGRVMTDLQGVEQAMASQMSRILVDGLIAGLGPKEIGDALNEVVDGLGKSRAAMIARTEIIRAHAEGQLDMLEELGMDEVGVEVEWLNGPKPCPRCAGMRNVVLKLKDAHGLIPVHPNCMCSFTPIPEGAVRPDQKRGKRKVSAALKMLLKAKPKKVGKGQAAKEKKLGQRKKRK